MVTFSGWRGVILNLVPVARERRAPARPSLSYSSAPNVRGYSRDPLSKL